MKKWLTGLLAVFFLLPAIPVFSSPVLAGKAAAITAVQGDRAEVALVLTDNPGVNALYLDVSFDTTVLTLSGVTDGGLLEDFLQGEGKNGAVRLSWQQADTTADSTAVGTLATLCFSVSANAPVNVYSVTVTPVPGCVLSSSLEELTADFTPGSIAVTCRHEYNWVTTVQPALGVPGEESFQCTKCGHISQRRTLPALTGPEAITSGKYTSSGGFLTGIGAETTVSQLLSGINERSMCTVLQGNTEVPATALAGTGMTVRLTVNGQTVQTLTLVVTGDTNGDGKINIADLLAVKAHILQKAMLSGAALKAGDTSGDGKANITDFMAVKAHILGKTSVTPHA